jgi:hypothetical protein
MLLSPRVSGASVSASTVRLGQDRRENVRVGRLQGNRAKAACYIWEPVGVKPIPHTLHPREQMSTRRARLAPARAAGAGSGIMIRC